MRMLLTASVILIGLKLQAADAIPTGNGSFDFKPDDKQTLKVWTCRPKTLTADSPVVIVMHGVSRNGEGYRDHWAPHSEKGPFLLLVPEFPEKQYPSAAYSQGNILDAKGKPNDPAAWAFTIIEKLFDEAKTRSGNTSAKYYLYGHSAGGQFVHRFVLFMPHARYERAIAANPGFYTFPTADVAYPYGLKGTPLQQELTPKVFERNFVLLLGEADTIRDDPNLHKSAEADKQGLVRFERGKNYYKEAKATAEKQNAKFNWKLQTVPGVGHSDDKMAPAAAKTLLAK